MFGTGGNGRDIPARRMGGNVLTNNKDLRLILKKAIDIGWQFKRGKKHIKGTRGNDIVILSATPSDFRVIKNIQKDLML